MLRTWFQQGQRSPHSLPGLQREALPWADQHIWQATAQQHRVGARRRLGGTAPATTQAMYASAHESLPYWTICSIKVFASKSLFKPSLGIIKACSVPRVFWIQ